MLRTIVYMRKSSEDETEKQAESIPRQRRDLEAYLERNSLGDASERLDVRDEDIYHEDCSAKKVGRPVFNKVIEKIKKGRGVYKVLLCTELTRLSRNPIDSGTLVSLLDEKERDVPLDLQEIRTLDHVFRPNPTDKFTLSLFLSVAKFENDVRAKNTSSGMQNRKSSGGTTNKAPCGYINRGEKKGKKWVEEDGENFYRVQKIWELFATGNYSAPKIAKEGAKMGITVINGDDTRSIPTDSMYRGMFRNRYYLGEVERFDEKTKKNIWVPGNHPKMITEELFNTVQLVLQKRGYKHRKVAKTTSYEAILNNVLMCGKTHRAMSFERKIRYTCSNCKSRFWGNKFEGLEEVKCPKCFHLLSEKDVLNREYRKYYTAPIWGEHEYVLNNEVKHGRSIPVEYVERAIDSELRKIYISPALYEILKKRLYGLWLDRRTNIDKRIKDARADIEKLDEKRRAIEERIARELDTMSEDSREDLEHSIALNRESIEEKERNIAQMREDLGEEFEKAWQILYTLFEARNIFSEVPNGDFEPKRKLLLSMVSNIIFLDGKITMKWNSPFDMLVTEELTKKKSQTKSEISD